MCVDFSFLGFLFGNKPVQENETVTDAEQENNSTQINTDNNETESDTENEE